MLRLSRRKIGLIALALTITLAVWLTPAPHSSAADHGDAPRVASDRGADLADAFLYLDPNDNTRVIVQMTIGGFIVSGESTNFGVFDPALRYRFQIENTGDARPDRFIDVRFSQRTAATQAQTATITLPSGRTVTAPATNPSATADTSPPRVVTDIGDGVLFFAGLVDDPFTFDIPAFGRFIASVRAGSPDPGLFSRGRDTFAGYNILAIALSFPVSQLRGTGNEIGLHIATQRQATQIINSVTGQVVGSGRFVNVDRTGIPAVNVALVPFARKDEFNHATTLDDANGRFAGDIVATLRALGTNDTNIGILASVAVTRGEFLRLDVTKPNTGPGGGNNPEAAFPNGRRLGDDVIDTLLFFIANQTPLSDNANVNEVPLTNTFPFFGLSHQPFSPGTTDDRTRN